MLEDQVTAAGFAAGLLESGLSPAAFADGPQTARTSGWAGAADALRRLGLRPDDEVRHGDLVAVLEGRHTGTGARVLREPVFYNMVFLAPRSVSFAWSRLGPGARTGIEEAVVASGRSLLAHLIEVAPLAGGVRLPRSFVAATVLHAIGTRSAALGPIPPALHVHACLFAVQDRDGALTAPHEATLADEDVQRECDAVAGAELAHRLTMLGYRVRNTAGAGTGHTFELEGVPQDLLDDEDFWRNVGCAV